MRKIVVYPNQSLREVSEKIEKVDSKLLSEIDDLKKMLIESDNGAGLAAPQIGINRRFFGLKKGKIIKVLINPQILGTWGERVLPMMASEQGEEEFLEGCLSFPDIFGQVRRYLKIKVSWHELIEGKLVSFEKVLSGFEAIVWQHESDHLDGVLFVDYLKKEGGKVYRWVGKVKEEISIKEVLA
ncbi:MAG TPA: peptide deformylase [Candidatus Woesebacteria bacterium]|nr:peptide deformylase [Candidatus Woesebacteria bacterium]HPJ17228.1 peptide deformylase [Candidatus Woesebacteria bacterium]